MDGDLDLILNGISGNFRYYTSLYSNNGVGQFDLVEATPFLEMESRDIAVVDVYGGGSDGFFLEEK